MVEITTNTLATAIQALSRAIDEEEELLNDLEESEESYALAESLETWRKAINELIGVYRAERAAKVDLPPIEVLIGAKETLDRAS